MIPEQIEGKTILLSPLDWGLGHATRCITLIKILEKKNRIFLAGDGLSGAFLQREFPHLPYLSLPGIKVKYPENGNMVWSMLKQSSAFFRAIRKEHELTQKLIHEHQIDLVVSDNRYGVYGKEIPSVFITHQVFIKAGIWSKAINRINHRYISKFDTLWIPDDETFPGLAGSLSHGKIKHPQTHYIGPFSDLKDLPYQSNAEKCDVLCLLSGPEPQRSIFENALIHRFEKSNLKITFIRGTLQQKTFPSQFHVIDFATRTQVKELMLNAEKIICRSGYSTIMDLHVLGKKAEFHPTPGQTEQMYLAQLQQSIS
jgi:uncharacterized protein (TIGR00661 family)